ncbi:MAG: aminopeptidase N C-terminal domain-containing protein, partial [Dinoroseobacter sp.]|nr:aminopeptidase N C-terminal domain-containing protein [Dinoroseobacter sp.]
LALALPSEDDLAQSLFEAGHIPDPVAIHTARRTLLKTVAERLEPTFNALYGDMQVPGAYTPDAKAAGRRALRATALRHLSECDGGDAARAQFDGADNMTEQLSAYSCLLAIGKGAAATDAFYTMWSSDRLVMDKWFALQVSLAAPEEAVSTCARLTEHNDFDWKNPNRFRSTLGALSMNPAGFHDPSGAGYELFADWLIKLDALNPQTTARMSTAFDTWRRYDDARQIRIKTELQRIYDTPGLSRDTSEMVGRILNG